MRAPDVEARRSGALAVLRLLLFVTFLDNTVVSVALADISTRLHVGVSGLQWVVAAYALVFASAMLPAGALADRYGRKRVLLAGAGVFCAGSLLCACAPGAGWLIAGRVVMGLGAAGSEPGTLSLIRQLFPDHAERTWAVGVWSATSGLALALGPVVGGIAVGLGTWRDVFWFTLALGLVAWALGWWVLPERIDAGDSGFDGAGALLAVAAMACLVGGLITGETGGYDRAAPVALFVLAGFAATGFGLWERRAARPLIDPALLRSPVFVTVNVAAATVYFGTFALFFFTALYLAEVVGQGGLAIALQFLPLTAGMVLASLGAGRLARRSGPRVGVTTGCLLFGAGLLATRATLGPHADYGPLAAALGLSGIGIGMAVVPLTEAVLDAVPAQRSSLAASVTNTSRELGAVLGVSVLGAIVTTSLTGGIATRLRALGLGSFTSLVVNGVESGQAPNAGSPAAASGPIGQVLGAVYTAFGDGLRTCLLLSALLVFATAVAAALVLRPAPVAQS